MVSTEAGRRTIQLRIDTGVFCLRGLSPERHRFELEYALERGSTANSVLFEAGDGAAAVLVHPPGAVYRSVFLPQLDALLGDVYKRQLDYLRRRGTRQCGRCRREYCCSSPQSGQSLLDS